MEEACRRRRRSVSGISMPMTPSSKSLSTRARGIFACSSISRTSGRICASANRTHAVAENAVRLRPARVSGWACSRICFGHSRAVIIAVSARHFRLGAGAGRPHGHAREPRLLSHDIRHPAAGRRHASRDRVLRPNTWRSAAGRAAAPAQPPAGQPPAAEPPAGQPPANPQQPAAQQSTRLPQRHQLRPRRRDRHRQEGQRRCWI